MISGILWTPKFLGCWGFFFYFEKNIWGLNFYTKSLLNFFLDYFFKKINRIFLFSLYFLWQTFKPPLLLLLFSTLYFNVKSILNRLELKVYVYRLLINLFYSRFFRLFGFYFFFILKNWVQYNSIQISFP